MKKLWLFGLVFLLCIASAMASHIDHNATSINVVTGTYTAGNITSTWVFGDAGANNTYNWSGVAATPGYEVRFNFSDITAERISYDLNIYGYTSESGHIVGISLYNFSGSAWVSLSSQEVSMGWAWANNTFYSQDFLNGDEVWGRAVHLDRGNPGEDFMIDFMVLTGSDEGILPELEYQDTVCPIDSIQSTMLYIFIGIIIFGLAIFASYTSILFFSIIVALVGMGYSFPLWGCNPVYGLVVFLGFLFYGIYEAFWRKFKEENP